MSYDRALSQVCPHFVTEEALFVQNHQIIRPLKPIAAVGSVKVLFNSSVEVPPVGVYTPASTTGSKIGPYNIQGGSTDVLVFKVGEDSPQTLVLPSGNRIALGTIVNLINRQVRGLVASVSPKNQLSLRTSNLGPGATFSIVGGTANGILGLTVNRFWRGKTVIPGWSVVSDPNTLSDRPTRLVVFDYPLKGYTDWAEVSYTTVRQECRRCGGLGVENDWRYGSRGDLVKVRDENLLIQELLKATYTVKGSNPFHSWYGTSIIEAIGKKLGFSGVVQNTIVADIHESFRRWQSIKKQQEENVGQQVTDEEYPYRLVSVGLEQSAQDPTIIFVSVQVQNRSNRAIQIDRSLRVPMPTDLLGSTQQQSILNQNLPNYNLVE